MWTHARIAKKVFAGRYSEYSDPETPIRRVMRDFEKAESLINGGFRLNIHTDPLSRPTTGDTLALATPSA